MTSFRYFAIAPTFFAIDISLSFSTTIIFLVVVAILLNASKVTPFVRAASPRTATIFSSVPFLSRAAAKPNAADAAVPAWPAPKASCSLSNLLQNPLMPSVCLSPSNLSLFLPVRSLCV